MITFKTESGSIYEVDLENMRCRRVTGVRSATPRQGIDGEWKKFKYASVIAIGGPVLFTWEVVVDGTEYVQRCTSTSRVTEILEML